MLDDRGEKERVITRTGMMRRSDERAGMNRVAEKGGKVNIVNEDTMSLI